MGWLQSAAQREITTLDEMSWCIHQSLAFRGSHRYSRVLNVINVEFRAGVLPELELREIPMQMPNQCAAQVEAWARHTLETKELLERGGPLGGHPRYAYAIYRFDMD